MLLLPQALCAVSAPRSPLYGSARLAHRSVALWELRLFFPQREDRDMERQLGFSRDPTGDRTSLGLAAACAIGATSFAATTPVTALAAASAPFLYLTGLAVAPGAVRGALDAVAVRLVPAIRERQAFHEAGHVVVGYLAGLPVDAAAVGVQPRFRKPGPCRFAHAIRDLRHVSLGNSRVPEFHPREKRKARRRE